MKLYAHEFGFWNKNVNRKIFAVERGEGGLPHMAFQISGRIRFWQRISSLKS
jgi:hypothetical protein